jgi:glucose/mannose transport system permease protein
MSINRVLIYSILTFFALLYLLPLVVMLITSLKDLDEIRSGTLLSLPQSLNFDAWGKAWGTACTGVSCEGLKGYFWNSVLIVVPAVVISTILGALNGYVLTKWKFKGSDLFFGMLLIGTMIPFQVILLPMARTLGFLGLAGTTSGLIMVHVIYGVAFTTLFFRNYYISIPSG